MRTEDRQKRLWPSADEPTAPVRRIVTREGRGGAVGPGLTVERDGDPAGAIVTTGLEWRKRPVG